MANKKQEESLEKSFKRLEEIKQTLQSSQVSIDEIVPLVEEADELYKKLKSGLESVKNILKEKEKED